jgi:3-oxoacyl-[acyl-carrier-protein] synthase-1
MSRRVFITGYGIISAIGNNAEENYSSLVNKRSGFGRLNFLDTVHRDELPSCEVKLSDSALCKLAGVPQDAGYTRTSLLALVAVREAIDSAALSEEEVRDAGILSATTAGGIRELET